MASLSSISALGAAAGRRTALSASRRRKGGAVGGGRLHLLPLLRGSFVTSSAPLLPPSAIPRQRPRPLSTPKSEFHHHHHQQYRFLETITTTTNIEEEDPDGPDQKAERGRPLQNEEIDYHMIYLRTTSSDSSSTSLSAPVPLADVLAQIDRKTHFLQLVVSPQPDWDLEPYPICRIVDKAAERILEKKLAKQRKENRIVTKTLELNWAISPHDLGHKLRRLSDFLSNGYKVEILLAPRRKGKKAAGESEAEEVIRRVEETAENCRAFEVKKRQGVILGTLRLYFQGPKPRKKVASKQAEDQTKDGEQAEAEDQTKDEEQAEAETQSEVVGEQEVAQERT